MTHRLIDTGADLARAATDLDAELAGAKTKRLYLDTEFESNRSGTKMCLLQVSAGTTSYLFDPLRLRDLHPLAELMRSHEPEWILHAGLQDVELIQKNLQVAPPARLFDTQIAWALLTPESSVSLAYLQYKLLGLRSEKAHQADDWVRRPLQASQLRYAASDVEHLPAMVDQLLEAAEKKNRVEVVFAASHDALHPEKEPPPRLTLSSFRNAWQLTPKSQAALRFLMAWYNGLSANERRSAPENKVLLSMASRSPEDLGALSRIKGVPRSTVNQYGNEIVSGLRAAIDSANSADFVPLEPPPYSTYEEIRLDAWLSTLRSELAVGMEFAPEFVLPGRLQKSMKAGLEAGGLEGLFEALVGWRQAFLAGPLRDFCESSPPPV